MKHPRVLTLGGATKDLFLSYGDALNAHLHKKIDNENYLIFKEGSKIELSNIIKTVGGGAINTASSFKKQGFTTTACCKVGIDEAGEAVREYLRKKDIGRALSRSGSFETGCSVILPAPDGDRVIFAYRGANTELSFDDCLWELSEKEIVYISSLSGKAAQLLPALTERARNQSVPLIACNPGASQLQEDNGPLLQALSFIDIFILNASEAQRLFSTLVHNKQTKIPLTHNKISTLPGNAPSLWRSFVTTNHHQLTALHYGQELLAHGPRIIVITNGSEGVYVFTKETILFHKSIPTKTISTVGAGDAFGSTFTASIYAGDSLEKALYKGLINSSSVLQHMNAHDGLLTRQELEQKLANFTPELISLMW